MSSNTTSPNMSLVIPTVGQEFGPQYAFDINNSLTLIDVHNHSPGQGVQINPDGININAPLPFNNNFAYSLAGLTLVPQGSAPANNTLYESGVDLYYVDGLGNNIRLTINGGIAGTTGSISGLVSPASASYISGSSTFVFQSNAGIAANLDAGSIVFRDLSPNSTFGVTVQPPAALGVNYSLTLPTLPSSKSFMNLDNSGAISTFPTDTLPTAGRFLRMDAAGAIHFINLYDLVVGPGGDYTTISAAITASSPGQSIFIQNGTYTENVVISSQLNIYGAGRGTVISGSVTFTSGSSDSLMQRFKANGITINSGVSEVQVLEFWNANGFSITDNGTGSYFQGMQE